MAEPLKQWSVIVQSKDYWSPVAEGTKAVCTDVVNLYHAKRPDLDAKVRLISPAGLHFQVEYGPATLSDALPLDP